MHFVYILRCSDGSYYVGHTEDPETREKVHNEGRGARYTALRRPVCLVYSEATGSLRAAVLRERQIKRWSRTKKEALMAGNTELLKRLARRRN